MTNCKEKCWCRKLKIKDPDGDAPPLMQDLFSMAHKIEHLYDGVEKCFERIERIDNSPFLKSKTYEPLFEKLQNLEDYIKMEDRVTACDVLQRISSLESSMKALTEMYKDISVRVVGLHDHHVRQIDENRKSSRRIDDIETIIDVRTDNNDRKPHKCPVCKGLGNPDITDRTAYGPRRHMIENDPCNSCKGTGIMWG